MTMFNLYNETYSSTNDITHSIFESIDFDGSAFSSNKQHKGLTPSYLTKAQKGTSDDHALLALIPKIRKFARNKVWEQQDRIDFEQDVMLIMVEAIASAKQIDDVNAFCSGVCNFQLLSYIRNKVKRQQYESLEPSAEEPPELINKQVRLEHNTSEQVLNTNHHHFICLSLITKLRTPRDREIIIEHCLYEKPINELVRKFEITTDHFYRVLHRAKKRLKSIAMDSESTLEFL